MELPTVTASRLIRALQRDGFHVTTQPAATAS
jgi:predicted RNA binding protein YcfA (HicA-like mRNA interferase family)